MRISMFLCIYLTIFFVATWGTKIIVPLVHRNSLLPAVATQEKSDAITVPLFVKSNWLFWANISIGEPPQVQLLVMDTGSELTWVGRANPKFNPDLSSTLHLLSCETSQQCNRYYRAECGRYYSPNAEEYRCVYAKRYLDTTVSMGVLAFDKFSFISSTEGTMMIPNALFGIETDSSNKRSPWLHGILGLGIGRNSLVSKVGEKFSYCIGNLSNPEYPYSFLILGDGAIFQGKWTPMTVKEDYGYLISIVGIRIEETELDIDKSKFLETVVLDTGSTLSTLPETEYEKFIAEVRLLLDEELPQVNAENGLCYYGNIGEDLKEFPPVTLHLTNGVNLILDAERMFIKYTDDIFCLAVTRSTTKYHMLGLHAQQYYNIGVNRDLERVFFREISCELLLD